jgi:hypothetical protein
MMNKPVSIWFCILMDLIGCLSYTIPVLGEFSDIVWAPISAIIFFICFRRLRSAFGSVFQLLRIDADSTLSPPLPLPGSGRYGSKSQDNDLARTA